MIYRCALRIQATIDSSVSELKLTDEVHKGPQKSDVQYLSFMSFNSTDTFSFDEPTTPELPGSLSDETIWVASSDDQALLGDVSYLFFLKCQTFESLILEVTSLCRIPGTAPADYSVV